MDMGGSTTSTKRHSSTVPQVLPSTFSKFPVIVGKLLRAEAKLAHQGCFSVCRLVATGLESCDAVAGGLWAAGQNGSAEHFAAPSSLFFLLLPAFRFCALVDCRGGACPLPTCSG